jgi:hypothetical protein
MLDNSRNCSSLDWVIRSNIITEKLLFLDFLLLPHQSINFLIYSCTPLICCYRSKPNAHLYPHYLAQTLQFLNYI